MRRRDTEPGNDTSNHLNGFNPSADNDALPASANNHRRRNESTLSKDSAESEPVPHSPLYRKSVHFTVVPQRLFIDDFLGYRYFRRSLV